jgi:PLP dependent protein
MEINQETRKLIYDNYQCIIERIKHTALNAGRDPADIKLIVVTKIRSIDEITCVIEAGARNLGENYIEEAIPKILALEKFKDIQWHMIGHLQSRKTQDFCNYFHYLHSLDSSKLAERISRYAQLNNKIYRVWLEFNISGEESKSGWNIWEEDNWAVLLPEIEKIMTYQNLDILGLMTVPPFSENPEDARPYFRKLRKFQQFIIKNLHPKNFTELSIGMSSDFEVAIQEGSTCVRIGQAILGPRIY